MLSALGVYLCVECMQFMWVWQEWQGGPLTPWLTVKLTAGLTGSSAYFARVLMRVEVRGAVVRTKVRTELRVVGGFQGPGYQGWLPQKSGFYLMVTGKKYGGIQGSGIYAWYPQKPK